jgi:hypothetical protein
MEHAIRCYRSDSPLTIGLPHALRPPLLFKHSPRVRDSPDQFRLLVRPEQARLAQLPVYREHDFRTDAGHRLATVCGGLIERAMCRIILSVRSAPLTTRARRVSP